MRYRFCGRRQEDDPFIHAYATTHAHAIGLALIAAKGHMGVRKTVQRIKPAHQQYRE